MHTTRAGDEDEDEEDDKHLHDPVTGTTRRGVSSGTAQFSQPSFRHRFQINGRVW